MLVVKIVADLLRCAGIEHGQLCELGLRPLDAFPALVPILLFELLKLRKLFLDRLFDGEGDGLPGQLGEPLGCFVVNHECHLRLRASKHAKNGFHAAVASSLTATGTPRSR
jgi:hypothetical protein